MILSADEIRQKAKSKRTSGSSKGWVCSFCHKTFSYEKSFMTHVCKEKTRFEEVRTPIGQAAFACYNQWMKLTKKGIQKIETFTSSSKYVTFIKFANYCKRLNINSEEFISFIIKHHPDISPALWCNEDVFSLYSIYLDRKCPPYEQVDKSLSFIIKQSEIKEIKVQDFFNSISFNELINFIKQKKISPWYIYTSKLGVSKLLSFSEDELQIFESAIKAHIWKDIFESDQNSFTELLNFFREPENVF